METVQRSTWRGTDIKKEGSAQIQRYINMTALMGARLKTDRGLQGVLKKMTNKTNS